VRHLRAEISKEKLSQRLAEKLRVILLREKSRSNLKIVQSFEIGTIHGSEWRQSD